MKSFSCDVEADGPCPPLFSMVSFGVALIEDTSRTYYAQLRPISDDWLPEALAVSGFTREQTLGFDKPAEVMVDFYKWLMDVADGDRIQFVSDTTSFDFAYMNYYCWKFLGKNPFGHSSLSLKDLYKGHTNNMRSTIHRLRDTKHNHNALTDALGNAEVYNKIISMMKEKNNVS